MRLLLLPLVLVAVLIMGARGASAEAQLPIETATPTATFEQSEIQLYFLQNYWPQYRTYHVKKIEADGVVCAEGVDGGDVYWELKSNDYIFPWPLDDWDGDEACGSGAPKTIRVTFGAPWAYVAELVWLGGDQVYSVHMQPTQNGTVYARRQAELGSSQIELMFTYNGSPLVSYSNAEVYLDGYYCGSYPGWLGLRVSLSITWPGNPDNPCTDVGGMLVFCSRPTICSEPFVFDEADYYEVEVPVLPNFVATATFTYQGKRVELSVERLLYRIGDVVCGTLSDFGRAKASRLSFPLMAGVDCGSMSYGDLITVEFDFAECAGLTGRYMWDGSEPNVDVQVRGECLGIVSPSPTEGVTQPPPTALPSPQVLPRAGGSGEGGSGAVWPFATGLLAIISGVLAVVAARPRS